MPEITRTKSRSVKFKSNSANMDSAKVRQLISDYERTIEPLEPYVGRKRAKSIGNALSYKQFHQPLEINSILDIEKELVKIEAHLNYYEVYDKETHVAFQEQLFNILTCIVSIDPEGHSSTVQKKKDLIGETQKLAKTLNLKLPVDGSTRTYLIKKQEAVVSTTTTSLNTSESDSISDTPPALYTPSVSKLRKFFSFRRDNVHTSSVSRTQSLNLKTPRPVIVKTQETIEEVSGPAASSPIEVYVEPAKDIEEYREEHSHNVSVSKLKSMFEERKKENDEGSYMNMTYMGMLRSVDIQKKVDMNKSKSMSDLKMHDFSEELDDVDDHPPAEPVKNDSNNNARVVRNLTKTFEHLSTHEESVHIEEDVNDEIKHILHRKVEPQELTTGDVEEEPFVVGMVGSLKHTFEQISSKEEPVLKVPIQLRTFPVHIEDTEGRTAIGLEIGAAEVEVPEPLIEEDVNAGIKHILHRTVEPHEVTTRNPGSPGEDKEVNGEQPQEESFVVGMVGSLRNTFERISSREESVLKVPIQLRTSPVHVEDAEASKTVGEEPFVPEPFLKVPIELRVEEDVNADIKHILHRQVEPHEVTTRNPGFPGDDEEVNGGQPQEESFVVGKVGSLKHTFERISSREEPVLKVPIQLRTFPVHEEDAEASKSVVEEPSEVSEPLLKVPIQLRTFPVHVDEDAEASTVVEEEPLLKVPIQLRVVESSAADSVSVATLKNSFEASSETNLIRETPVEADQNLVNGSSVCVETLKSSFEVPSKVEGPLLKVPVQLRITPDDAAETAKDSSETELVEVDRSVEGGATGLLSVSVQRRSVGGTDVEINGTSVAALKTSFESPVTVEQKVRLRVPVELRVENNAASYNSKESIEAESGVSSSRAQIERTTRGLVKILESPTSFSTLTSTSNHSHHEVTDISHSATSFSSTKITQRITSTSVSSKIQRVSMESQAKDEDSGVTIEEIDDSDLLKKSVHLSDSQENILDEVLNDTNGHNIDEEFEKMF